MGGSKSGDDPALREEAASMDAEGHKIAAKHKAESRARAAASEEAVGDLYFPRDPHGAPDREA